MHVLSATDILKAATKSRYYWNVRDVRAGADLRPGRSLDGGHAGLGGYALSVPWLGNSQKDGTLSHWDPVPFYCSISIWRILYSRHGSQDLNSKLYPPNNPHKMSFSQLKHWWYLLRVRPASDMGLRDSPGGAEALWQTELSEDDNHHLYHFRTHGNIIQEYAILTPLGKWDFGRMFIGFLSKLFICHCLNCLSVM